MLKNVFQLYVFTCIYIYIDMVVVAGAPLIPHVPHERSQGREQHACQSRLPQ